MDFIDATSHAFFDSPIVRGGFVLLGCVAAAHMHCAANFTQSCRTSRWWSVLFAGATGSAVCMIAAALAGHYDLTMWAAVATLVFVQALMIAVWAKGQYISRRIMRRIPPAPELGAQELAAYAAATAAVAEAARAAAEQKASRQAARRSGMQSARKEAQSGPAPAATSAPSAPSTPSTPGTRISSRIDLPQADPSGCACPADLPARRGGAAA